MARIICCLVWHLRKCLCQHAIVRSRKRWFCSASNGKKAVCVRSNERGQKRSLVRNTSQSALAWNSPWQAGRYDSHWGRRGVFVAWVFLVTLSTAFAAGAPLPSGNVFLPPFPPVDSMALRGSRHRSLAQNAQPAAPAMPVVSDKCYSSTHPY